MKVVVGARRDEAGGLSHLRSDERDKPAVQPAANESVVPTLCVPTISETDHAERGNEIQSYGAQGHHYSGKIGTANAPGSLEFSARAGTIAGTTREKTPGRAALFECGDKIQQARPRSGF
jgi:hypothetical protein